MPTLATFPELLFIFFGLLAMAALPFVLCYLGCDGKRVRTALYAVAGYLIFPLFGIVSYLASPRPDLRSLRFLFVDGMVILFSVALYLVGRLIRATWLRPDRPTHSR